MASSDQPCPSQPIHGGGFGRDSQFFDTSFPNGSIKLRQTNRES